MVSSPHIQSSSTQSLSVKAAHLPCQWGHRSISPNDANWWLLTKPTSGCFKCHPKWVFGKPVWLLLLFLLSTGSVVHLHLTFISSCSLGCHGMLSKATRNCLVQQCTHRKILLHIIINYHWQVLFTLVRFKLQLQKIELEFTHWPRISFLFFSFSLKKKNGQVGNRLKTGHFLLLFQLPLNLCNDYSPTISSD